MSAWSTPNSRTSIVVPFQHGKQLVHTTPVWTTKGWKTHGELRVDDYVYSPDGLPVRVEALSPDSTSNYRVTFSDGSVIQCHAKHEWLVHDRSGKRLKILETWRMFERKLRGDSHYVFSVPRIAPLIAPDRKLHLHPYVLGAWLGDGHYERPLISHAGDDWEVINEFQRLGYKCIESRLQTETGVYYSKFDDMMVGLNAYGLTGDKHIPEDYLLASEEQRMELLAGLIDTDGNYSADKRGNNGGQYRFTNTNKRLIDQTAFLARTLGFKVGIIQEYEPTVSSSGIQGREVVYVVVFSPTRTIPCRIPRKRATRLSEPCRLAIAAIDRVEPKPGRCIQVEGGMYLVGEGLVPTHNSVLSSVYFPSWVLLLWPETRVGLGSYEESFAAGFGGKVRDVVNRFGPGLDPPRMIRTDTSAKGEWVIDKFGGGMVCKGRGGALVGRPVDLLILDDLIKNAVEAQSPTILDEIWDWYCTVAYSRLGPKAPVVGVGTRWGPKDLFGRWEAEAKVGGDKFDTLLFKAIADARDPLGRQPGEALWPERVPLARLERIAQNRPRWFKTCWQGEPEETLGLHFQPREWQRYTDVGDAWRVRVGTQWNNYRKVECTIVLALDWAQKGKRDSDKTAFAVAAMTHDGLTLILAVYSARLRYEENAPTLAEWCRRWEPEDGRIIVVGEDDMLSDAMTVECRRYRDIPEIRRIAIKGKGKLVRAQAAIIRSQNGRFLLPAVNEPWYEEMCDQLTSFSGAEGAEDDIADCFGILGRMADEFTPMEDQEDDAPLLGAQGYYGEWMG